MNENQLVTADVCGGLGNQLFIIAALLEYAELTNSKAILEKKEHYGNRNAYWDSVFEKLTTHDSAQKSGLYLRLVPKLDTDDFVQCREEQEMTYNPLPLHAASQNVIFFGYFQSPRYFDNISFRLFDALTPRPDSETMRLVATESAKLNGARDKRVSLHVRRTDYLTVEQGRFHGVLGLQYYCSAIDWMKERLESPVFIVFSDDLTWCKEQFSFIADSSVDYVSDSVPDYVAFYLMAFECQAGHIIANSTFSWWAAWLGWQQSLQTTPVVLPRPWMGPTGHKKTEFVVGDWHEIANV